MPFPSVSLPKNLWLAPEVAPGKVAAPIWFLRGLPRLAAVASVLLGTAVLAGWWLDVSWLKSVLPGLVTMKANTALGIVLLGFGLLGSDSRLFGASSPGLRFAAWGAVVIGVLTLLEYGAGWNLGIDQLLAVEPPSAVGTSAPGRMAVNTAAIFVLLGGAILLLDRRPAWAQRLALLAGGIALLALVGYAYGTSSLYQVSRFTQIAVHTAAVFTLLAVAVLLARPDAGFIPMFLDRGPSGVLARRLVSLGLLPPIALGGIVTAGVRAGLLDFALGAGLLVLSSVLVFTAAAWWSAATLHRSDTERRRAESSVLALNEELRTRASQLEAANQELESFSYSVSHDLRAPLRAVDGFSRILLEEHGTSLGEGARRHLGTIRREVLQMGQLIDDLLRFSRLNRQSIQKHRVRPEIVVREALNDLRPGLEGRTVNLRVDDLPECWADPRLLRQVYQNLLDNALKFTRPRATAEIRVGATSGLGGTTVYFVADNGVGLDMAYANKLFGVFQRLHRAEEFPGTGVGLAIVQRIVHRHGGRVWVEAAVDKGATFSFTLEHTRSEP